ncbi:MAG: MFS transporter [Pseudomonadales bacterium]|nr:MFS transporter [Pseudomonadales bacterium]NIX09207.1 MFS transporter [Pseudomonadales bacterium]
MTDQVQQGTTAAAEDAPARTPWRSWYALGVLFVVYVFNFIDRSILGILNQAIKEDLALTDTQMGFLGGIAFAVFYTFLGIPIARLADRTVRRNLLAACLTIWSVMTALCGLAASFTHLLLARIGVAVGEAGGSPPSHSMISDMFPESSRATALAIYALGIPVGTMIGNLAGGWINEAFDWRTAFIVVGLPGVLLAFVVVLTVREPVRGAADNMTAATGDAPPVKTVFRYLWSLKSFRYLSLAGALHAFVGYGVGYWFPAFFIRSHGLGTGEIGTWLFYLGFAGMAGTFLGGYMGDRLARRDVRWYVWLPGIATLASVPFSIVVYLHDDYQVAFMVAIVPTLLGAYYLGPTFALTQGLVGLRMRALASSILLFILNLIGLGLGPQVTGILSDVFNAFGDLGTDSLRYALICVLLLNVVATVYYGMAGRDLKKDLARRGELDG